MRILSPASLLVVVVFAALLFGGKRLPDVARGIGRSLRILKSEGKALRGEFAAGAQAPGAQPAAAVAEPERVVKSAPGASGASRTDRAA